MDDFIKAATKRAIAALTGPTVSIEDARNLNLLPEQAGLYAWWIVGSALPMVPPNPHPVEEGVDLGYIGIAPSGPKSESSLRSRVVKNHLDGNLAVSTLRRSLAALLLDSPLELEPLKKGSKVVLSDIHNAKLSAWQLLHLRLTWYPTANPWLLEGAVIDALRPPLNLEKNKVHPFHPKLSAARRKLRERAV